MVVGGGRWEGDGRGTDYSLFSGYDLGLPQDLARARILHYSAQLPIAKITCEQRQQD